MRREYIRPEPIPDILAEHIDEAAFLYQCRRRVNSSPERSWEDLRDYDRRMIPHIHALSLGGRASAEMLKEKLALPEDGDAGETFVAAIVYPMLGLVEPMEWLMEAIAVSPPHLQAIVDGLKLSMGGDLDGWLEFFLGRPEPTVRAVGAEVIGYRGAAAFKQKILSLQTDPDPAVALAAIGASAALGISPQADRIRQVLGTPASSLFLKAIELLLRIGDSSALPACRSALNICDPQISQRLCLYLGISGTLDDAALIKAVMERQPENENACLFAFGLCGNVEYCEFLIQRLESLENLERFACSYQALRLISGKDFLPQFDPDEAKPEEILRYRNFWKEWWDQNRDQLSGKFKWRRGEKISPAALHKDLLWRGHPCRDLACVELTVRYGCPVTIQHDQFYEVQARQLCQAGLWTEKENGHFVPGQSYYFGRPLR